MSDEFPDSLDEAPNVIELGGAIGRTASIECRQGQHDLCPDAAAPPTGPLAILGDWDGCRCRCHE